MVEQKLEQATVNGNSDEKTANVIEDF